jgi:enoyl-CoA hydratase
MFHFDRQVRLQAKVKPVSLPFMAESPHLSIDRTGAIVTVIMNRPATRNAMDLEMLARMADAWDAIDSDPSVRVAILTGAGGHFSSGSDLKVMAGAANDPIWAARFEQDRDLHWKALLRHYRLKKPLIAAVEGTCVAGGTEILQATDIRIAGASAKFGVAEARWGLFPLGGSTVRLRRQIPYCRAMDILLTGRPIPAPEALEIGLIGRIVPDGEALAAAQQVAAQIAENGPIAVQAIKRSVLETEGLPEAEALALELEIGQRVFESSDAKEGPAAFVAKRKPNFTGS